MDPLLLFCAFVGALLLMMALRIPVAVSMGIIGIVGTALFVSPGALVQIANIAYSHTWSFVLVVVPLFILMGEIISSSGLGESLFRAAAVWLRRLPGGLAIGTITACTGFAAVCGSSTVTAATMGAVAVPEMVKNGYAHRLALGATAAGGTLGILIPPSIPMILYGVISDSSIGALFMAGILPGIMMAVLMSLTVAVQVMLRPEIAPTISAATPMRDRVRYTAQAAPILIVALMVVGSIYAGLATPTEAGAIGAVGSILVALAMRRLRLRLLQTALDRTARTTAMFMLLLIGGLFSSFLLTRLGVPQGLSTFLVGLDTAPWLIIVAINILLIVLGMFLDPLSILVIVVPIFLKTIVGLGYDPIWFGIIVTIQIEIAAITPPVGFNLFILKSAVPDVTLDETVWGSIVFVVPLIAGIAVLTIFPDIALWLPELTRLGR